MRLFTHGELSMYYTTKKACGDHECKSARFRALRQYRGEGRKPRIGVINATWISHPDPGEAPRPFWRLVRQSNDRGYEFTYLDQTTA